MVLEKMLILRLKGDLKDRLNQLAVDYGVSKSVVARSVLSIALEKPTEPSQLEVIVARIRKQTKEELYERNGEQTKKVSNDGEGKEAES